MSLITTTSGSILALRTRFLEYLVRMLLRIACTGYVSFQMDTLGAPRRSGRNWMIKMKEIPARDEKRADGRRAEINRKTRIVTAEAGL